MGDHRSRVPLRFGNGGAPVSLLELSAVHSQGKWLWLAGDELAQVDRLTWDDEGAYGDHRTFPLADLVDLPGGPDEEVDVEGMDRFDAYLWVVGSHSRTRKRPKPKHADDAAIEELAKIRNQANRHVLARIPLADLETDPTLARATSSADGQELSAAILDGELTQAVAEDEHLGPFRDVPGKDNGFNVEGLAVFEDRVLVGLRGPVLRGWAVVLELSPREDPDRPGHLTLGTPPYRKRFLDLDGLGVRDLCRMGDDVLVLAGPTMDLDGPARVYRWLGAAHAVEGDVVRGDEIIRLVDVPYGDGDDHPEGLTVVEPADGEGRPSLLVVYDSPAEDRMQEEGTMLADRIELPG